MIFLVRPNIEVEPQTEACRGLSARTTGSASPARLNAASSWSETRFNGELLKRGLRSRKPIDEILALSVV
jgi:hypothetical protein